MTLKTSFFNKGIYKSTVRRYLWGSVLYFIILFMTTVLPVLMTVEPDDKDYFIGVYGNLSLLYDYSRCMIFPITLAIGVSTVVGLLVYRFIHSKKTSVFTHSLPVNRTSVYVSTLAGAFTLMFVPVILNGLIFLIMSVVAYSNIISVSSCFAWIGVNLLCIFMMFACTTFVAMLTGNTFATVALNILFHAVIPIAVLCFSFVAEQFLFGYVSNNAVMKSVVEGNFIVWIYNNVSHICYGYNDVEFEFVRMYIYLAISVLLYVLGWVLYKKRNLETAEDVAGFGILNPVFKYLVTFLGATVSFALFSEIIAEKLAVFIICVALISAIAYFAAEMILKKTMKVWKKSYKGFIAFAIVYTLLILLFAFTSFFGYETYVPEADEVESAAVYGFYYDDMPYIDDPGVIDYAVKLHGEFVNNRTLLKDEWDGSYSYLHIEYKLKNGDEVSRAYLVDERKFEKTLEELYEFESYKSIFEEPLNLDIKDIQHITFSTGTNVKIYGDMMAELHKCVVEDFKNMSYDEIYSDSRSSAYGTIYYYFLAEGYNGELQQFERGYTLSPHFEKTLEWFNNNKDRLEGYYYSATDEVYEDSSFCIVKFEHYNELAESLKHSGLVFESLSWRIDDLTKGNIIFDEITDYNLETKNVILVEGESAKNVYDYIKTSDNAVSNEGLWYIYGEVSYDEFYLVDAITSDEAEAFKEYVCK